LYVDVDALKDPNPDKAAKAYPRKRPADHETVKEGNPPIGNTLATKLRVWQIVPPSLKPILIGLLTTGFSPTESPGVTNPTRSFQIRREKSQAVSGTSSQTEEAQAHCRI